MILWRVARALLLLGAWLAPELMVDASRAAESAMPATDTARSHFASSIAIDPLGASPAGDRCITIHDGSERAQQASRFADFTCNQSIPSSPHQLAIHRGELTWTLQMEGQDQTASSVRSSLAFDHALSSAPFTGWRLHADAVLDRPESAMDELPVEQQMHVSLGKRLSLGWDLLFALDSMARGAFDPSSALQHASTFAVTLTRAFRFTPFGSEHRVTLQGREERDVDQLYGADQRTSLVEIDYAHSLDIGAFAAKARFTTVQAASVASQSEARAEINLSRQF